MTLGTKRWLLCAVFMAASQVAAAGTYMEFTETRENSQQPPVVHKYFVAADRMRTETGGTVVIMRLDKNLSWALSVAAKKYQEMTFEQLKAVSDQARLDMAARLKGKPPDQRPAMEKNIRAMGLGHLLDPKPVPMVVQYMPEKSTVEGHACKKVLFSLPPFSSACWVASDWTLDPAARAFFKAYEEKLGAILSDPNLRMVRETFLKLDGVPVEAILSYKSAKGEESKTKYHFTVVKTMEFPAETFDIPAGFTRAAAPNKTAAPGGAPAKAPPPK